MQLKIKETAKSMTAVEKVMEILESAPAKTKFGIRGLSGYNAEQNYVEGQILDCSCDLDEDRGVERYTDKKIAGTSAVMVHYYMTEKEIEKAINAAKNYSDNGKICLISGEFSEEGADYLVNEVVISNEVWSDEQDEFIKCGATFVTYLD